MNLNSTCLRRFLAVGSLLVFTYCGDSDRINVDSSENTPPVNPTESMATAEFDGQFARDWVDVVFDATRRDVVNPLRGARLHAYTMLTLYEGVVNGMPQHRSLSGQLREFSELPKPQNGQVYDWVAVMASAMDTVVAELFEHPDSDAESLALMNAQMNERQEAGVPLDALARSADYGRTLGVKILEYAATDGYAEIKNKEWTLPADESYWVPTPPDYQPAMEPYWGTLRQFAMNDPEECQAPDPVPFSTEPGSPMYLQAQAVVDATVVLTPEEQAQALYWEDAMGLTAVATGQVLAIIKEISLEQRFNLAETAEALGVTMVEQADGFISAWDQKYDTMVMRPQTYVTKYIDPNWNAFLYTPQFPEYPSGHSVSAGGYSTVLPTLVGDMSFTNHTYDYLGYAPRAYTSFEDAALDDGWSRMYAGVHYPMAIENGISMGKCIAETFLSRVSSRK